MLAISIQFSGLNLDKKPYQDRTTSSFFLFYQMFARSFRQALRTPTRLAVAKQVSPIVRLNSAIGIRSYSAHHEETYEEFSQRYEKEFDEAYDLFEVQVSQN
ncbi:BA75_03703T0 [Komagataella pastoris]|uniref:BA75_03703T0 n=1 Tax=Komagataella pastoris TaxID=4922 RepID=A0A1B2JFT1_PICPA|nr:BA75_03703T0 [Komagataella pastoris]